MRPFRNSRTLKFIALSLALTLLSEIVFPTAAWALTGGPSQPEVQAFEPVGTTDMVDLFTGDFNYNIPLMDVEGYPINIAYHSGVTADQEASWVGLGWNINPGTINRNMRGVPDDYNGDIITKKFHIKEDKTLGFNLGIKGELIGLDKHVLGLNLGVSFGIFNNSYRGRGYEFSVSPTLAVGDRNKGALNANLGYNSQSGVNIGANLSLRAKRTDEDESVSRVGSASVGASYNSRGGLKSLSFGFSSSVQQTYMGVNGKGQAVSSYSNATMSSNSAAISFGSQTYTPAISMPMVNEGLVFTGSLGLEFLALHPGASLTGYYNKSKLETDHMQKPAYGYLNAHAGKGNADALQDFNREKDAPFTREQERLPVTTMTYDLWSVSGHGIGGMYRPYRNDIGIVGDDMMKNTSRNLNISAEVGIGGLLHAGLDITNVNTNTVGKTWNAWNSIGFVRPSDMGKADYEASFFKRSGELVRTDIAKYNQIGGARAVRMGMRRNGGSVHSEGSLVDDNNQRYNLSPTPHQNATKERQPRMAPMTPLYGSEATAAFEENIYLYGINQQPNANGKLNPVWSFARVDNYRKPHHITELTVNSPHGMRYVYGIPAYNNFQQEITFGLDASAPKNCGRGQVNYSSYKQGNEIKGRGGSDLYNEVVTPGYAHSYLLTAVLSDDYVDLTGDGVSDDDLGTAVKFNYSRAHIAYKWRLPFHADSASYSLGFGSDAYDDRASIVYGEKEVWYVHSIETKNYIALFSISERNDGYGVNGIHGGLNTNAPLYKLDSITLYAKFDGKVNDNPLKVVRFYYDYSLCPGIDNSINGGGKLTLKKIVFVNGTSQKGYRNAYEFTYSNNYAYNLKAYDRWGNYLARASSGCDPNQLYTFEAPYTDQDKTKTDAYTNAWCLSEIALPSGAKIKVTYEADDYAYVQDRPAMQMFELAGIGTSSSFSSSGSLMPGKAPATYLFFKLQAPNNPVSLSDISHYIRKMEYLYYNAYLKLKDGKYDYIRGYAKVDYGSGNPFGKVTSGGIEYGYVKIATVSIGDKEDGGRPVNPISKSAWQFMRLDVPHLAYPGSAPDAGSKEGIVGLAAALEEMIAVFKGYNRMMLNKGVGVELNPSKSFIRLYTPYGRKLGGGSRVKRIEFADNWKEMSGRSTAESVSVGQEYSYTLPVERGRNADGSPMSSGVASWEPEIGGDENPFRTPIPYKVAVKAGADNYFYQENPYGESLMPAPIVGYSYVTVKQLAPASVGIRGTGYTVSEFYTAKDFPVRVTNTHLYKTDNVRSPGNVLKQFFNLEVQEVMGASQGYSIELNDMHGKPKAQYVYGVGANNSFKRISGVKYEYYTDPENEKMLASKVPVFTPDREPGEADLGLEYDITVDMREQKTSTITTAGQIQVDIVLILLAVIPIPTFWPKAEAEYSDFYSACVTKVVNRHGLLKRTIAFKEGSEVATENMAFDSETGEVLLTMTQNEFQDTLYSFSIPAHWTRPVMGSSYMRTGIRGEVSQSSFYTSLLKNNDEIYIVRNQATLRCRFENGQLRDEIGNTWSLAAGDYVLFKRVAELNKAGAPAVRLVSRNIPYHAIKEETHAGDRILDASGTLYRTNWGNSCNLETPALCPAEGAGHFVKFFQYLKDSNQLCTTDSFLIYDSSTGAGVDDFENSPIKAEIDGLYPGALKYYVLKSPCQAGKMCYTFAVENPSYTVVNPALINAIVTFDLLDCSAIDTILTTYTTSTHANYKLLVRGGDRLACIHYTFEPLILSCGIVGTTLSTNEPAQFHRFNTRTDRPQSEFYQTTVRKLDDLAVARNSGEYEDFAVTDYASFPDWRPKNKITKYSPSGQPCEEVDPLGNYSSAHFAYNYALPRAVAANSRQHMMAVCDFDAADERHISLFTSQWKFRTFSGQLPTYDNLVRHSGRSSAIQQPGDTLVTYVYSGGLKARGEDFKCFADAFVPDTSRFYLSAWVKVDEYGAASYGQACIKIQPVGLEDTYYFYPSGPIIDGWQRIEGYMRFSECVRYDVMLCPDGENTTWFDDVRIHPDVASLKTYVYDPLTLRLMATLDENNFATYYEYDREGNLIRIKRETERGVMTIQESRQSIIKN